jgi:hypothetical protein
VLLDIGRSSDDFLLKNIRIGIKIRQNVVRMTKIPINVRIPLKYDPKQNVVRMTKIPINVSRPLKYDSKQNVGNITI